MYKIGHNKALKSKAFQQNGGNILAILAQKIGKLVRTGSHKRKNMHKSTADDCWCGGTKRRMLCSIYAFFIPTMHRFLFVTEWHAMDVERILSRPISTVFERESSVVHSFGVFRGIL